MKYKKDFDYSEIEKDLVKHKDKNIAFNTDNASVSASKKKLVVKKAKKLDLPSQNLKKSLNLNLWNKRKKINVEIY